MFRHRHSIHKWYVDEKTSLREEKHKRINRELIKLRCLIKSVADEHFCKIQSICMRKIFINNAKQMSCTLYKRSEHLQNMIYNDDDCQSQESYFFIKLWCNDCLFNNIRYIQRSNSNHYY